MPTFDTITYSSLIYYKLPAVGSLALLAGVLFLFYRRRFRLWSSVCLSLLFVLSPCFLKEIQNISPELPFLLFSMLAFWLLELAIAAEKRCQKMVLSVLMGVALFATHVTRLNGLTIVAVVAISHFVFLLQRRNETRRLWAELLPYALWILLVLGARLILPTQTSNLSDVGDITFRMFQNNLSQLLKMIEEWFASMFSRTDRGVLHYEGIGTILLVIAILYILVKGVRRQPAVSVFVIGYPFALALLSYATTQGMRYLYSILPFLLMYAAMGLRAMFGWIGSHCDPALKRVVIFTKYGLAGLLLGLVVFQSAAGAITCYQNRGADLEATDCYSTFAVDAYRYIRQETPEDCTIAFYKPRALYLNTGRVSFKPQIAQERVYNENLFLPYQPRYQDLAEADYLLLYGTSREHQYEVISEDLGEDVILELEYENPMFEMYRVFP